VEVGKRTRLTRGYNISGRNKTGLGFDSEALQCCDGRYLSFSVFGPRLVTVDLVQVQSCFPSVSLSVGT
jgi:hypothetical protein